MKLELAEACSNKEKQEKNLEFYREMRARGIMPDGAVDAAELQQGAAYLEALDVRIANHQEKVNEALRTVKERTEQVRLVMRERKVLDYLRERELTVFKYNQSSEEQKEIDEVANNRHNRGRCS